MSQQAEQLLRRYNEWRRKTAHFQSQAAQHPMRDLAPIPKNGPNRLEYLDKLIGWCSTEGIDPERWIYTMFSAYRWRHTPPFNNLIPKNPKKSKTYELYFKSRETPEYERVVRQRVEAVQEQRGQRFDPNRDLSSVAEHLKRQYLSEQNAQGCMADMGRTFGYHPKSVACARCPIQTQCTFTLQSHVTFNIIALRRGEITTEQAYGIGGLDVTR